MEIRDLLAHKGKETYTIGEDQPVMAAVDELNDKHVGALVVTEDSGHIVGIVSERDVLRNLKGMGSEKKVKDIMTPRDHMIIGHESDSVEYAMSVFTKNKIRHLPVIEGEKLVGLVSIGDVVRASLDNAEFENKNLRDYITGSFAT
jgi:CBS domain-containing protein